MTCRWPAVLALASCHLVTETSTVRPGATHHDVDHAAAAPRAPALAIGDDGALRFIEPLDCPGQEVVEQDEVITRSTQANPAALVVGLVLTAAGGIAAAYGGLDSSAGIAIAGVAGLAVGLPLAIGPFVGDGEVDRAGAPHPPLRHAGTSEPCGERPLAGTAATLDAVGVEVAGKIDATGAYSVSPYLLVDAFDPRAALDVRAEVATGSGARTFSAVVEPDALARGARAFLAHPDFDASVQPLRVVPNLDAATPRVSLTATADGPAARVVLAVTNNGPGDTWQLRGAIETGVRALDGRILYIGHVAKGETATRELLIPLTASSASALRNATIDLAIELKDAHGTAPSSPVHFHGLVLGDAPR